MGAAYPITGTGDLPDGQPGREVRSSRFFAATLKVPDRPEQQIAVRNVSPHGLGARAETPPAMGAIVIVNLAGVGDVEGEVRWVTGNRFGVKLDGSIDTSKFNFSGRSWEDVTPRSDSDGVADRFKPESSTWRPGFRTR